MLQPTSKAGSVLGKGQTILPQQSSSLLMRPTALLIDMSSQPMQTGAWAAGATMVLAKDQLQIIDYGKNDSGRIAFVKIVLDNYPMVIASVYEPAQPNER